MHFGKPVLFYRVWNVNKRSDNKVEYCSVAKVSICAIHMRHPDGGAVDFRSVYVVKNCVTCYYNGSKYNKKK